MQRRAHTAWTPSSLPSSIVVLGGGFGVVDGAAVGGVPFTAEIVPGIYNTCKDMLLNFPLRWPNISTETSWTFCMRYS